MLESQLKMEVSTGDIGPMIKLTAMDVELFLDAVDAKRLGEDLIRISDPILRHKLIHARLQTLEKSN